ncbi:enoyl-CoA hydratase [Massilia sp. P8910]|uniref:Enoyl-CoA hydratase n=1 Tax=Massilia antarctica TaxID=2765360 RepID=A0AA48WI93_9BURK|nr:MULTISPECIES: enoyl-CoA hydratase [Massilia]CUI07186.1 Enoyl-CoA hydratase [Janthinobacterium sp. CG23_2]MCE3606983.1 enoyl-CoA hydratase [Massilia antarctica]MCY0915198.1 enoyl-CoA hydratase [Massilia sp. H27-R4]QPI52192.1 enoyl-CoA hydratase [Massilia antarctica]CUU30972.1 Enoyl-CoA hydratase [Janthinobacterium sp. CG23_2]
MNYADLLIETHGKVAVIRLNRPKALNALNDNMMDELGDALYKFDADSSIGCIILTGSEKAFAAGADIAAMVDYDYGDTYGGNYIGRNWEHILNVRKPVIGVVQGFCLGGGCELAMMCDFLIAADTAKFGQPEIKVGVTPGAGGTQRLPRTIGKAKAMDMLLTARMIDAAEAERTGLVSRVVAADKVMEEALAAATTIASMSVSVAMAIKDSVNRAFETTLTEGVRYERRYFHAAFGTPAQKEGMQAFLAKRPANFDGL